MRIGICTSIENIKAVEMMGFDYIEPFVSEVAKLDAQSFEAICGIVENSPIKCEAFCVLFPKDIRLTGQDVSKEKITTYLESAFARIKRLGAKIVVFGSGGARNCPEGWEYEKAVRQLIEVARITGDIAGSFDIDIVMEPLNQKESNILNSVSEGMDFVEMVNHPHIKLLADFYHMRMENESMSVISKASPMLRHLHIANSHGRVYPSDPSEDIYKEFFGFLNNIGYEGRLSVEAKTDNMEKDGTKALELLKSFALR